MLVSGTVIEQSSVSFGTSGARGLVTAFTPNVCAAFTHAFIDALQQERSVTQVALAIDNRPSSYSMAQACAAALCQQGIDVHYYGVVPTPALARAAMTRHIPAIMVTGSHIPFDRNGLKFYRADGEITKEDEARILAAQHRYPPLHELPDLTIDSYALNHYLERYVPLFESDFLAGKRIGIYEHSSAGREIYHLLFRAFGAETISLERSDTFVPIDTEAVADTDRIKAKTWSQKHQLDMIFSTDGDGDRPLVADENGEWLRGDILGLLCAQALNVDALSVPVNCNSIIYQSPSIHRVILTKIGSPYVIAEFEQLKSSNLVVAGFEANGGFLLASDTLVNGNSLKALPTRDAVLPALMLLYAARNTSISNLVNTLPKRFTHSDRLTNYAVEKSRQLIANGENQPESLIERLGIEGVSVKAKDMTDGLRLSLSDGAIIHLRPSGNAPELRCYAEANTSNKAQALVNKAIAMLAAEHQ
ncbi:phosphomannomutase [Vibrio sp. SM6]|uniref:Phosphomannomutase n=1 Tax=Vibrio agarilyticus TaxID=2726741 RepID=A0A7X8TPS4_9VIBR|nr:phosphomannomutase [Vibrio agarilyticus]NLS12479.1 phosphomannomutase [Vibrio agarilyticus]